MRDYTRQVLVVGVVMCVSAHAQSEVDALTSGVFRLDQTRVVLESPVVTVSIDTTDVFDSTRPERWAGAIEFIDTLLMDSLAPEMTLSDDAPDASRSGSAVFSTRLSLRDR
jgi:hypothetical protein